MIRPRDNRANEEVRARVRETHVELDNLIYPMFLIDGNGIRDEITSLPGNFRWSLDLLLEEIGACVDLGITRFVLFPVVAEELKDKEATCSYDPANFYLVAATRIKEQYPDIELISDVAMDPYSSDGHDGLVRDGIILNDETLPILARMAVAQAEAGFDVIGPSDMMDGRVGYIRKELNAAGQEGTRIMSYTAKYASAFYGPFRDALDSAPKEGDKKTYQMDPANKEEALLEAKLDIQEGADFLMVKPALHYLDIIHLLRSDFDVPIAAYHVSGECAMLMAACKNGWLDYDIAMPETILSIKRAGAEHILTYFAKDFARMKREGRC